MATVIVLAINIFILKSFQMKIDVLEECIRLLGYSISSDDEVIDELLKADIDILYKNFITELNINLLAKESKEGQRAVLKHYIFEFWEINLYLIDYYKRYYINKEEEHNGVKEIFSVPNIELIDINSKYFRYVDAVHELLELLFEQIEICCVKYGFNFFSICDELNFNTQYTGASFTEYYESLRCNSENEKLAGNPSDTRLEILDNVSPRNTYFLNERVLPHVVDTMGIKVGTINTPKFRKDLIPEILHHLENFFSENHATLLKDILLTGQDAPEILVFNDHGNRLADAFKQLKKSDIISQCEQIELERWIHRNFKYRYRKREKQFTLKYLNDIISTNKDLCRKPILNVKIIDGKVTICKAE